MIKLYGYQEKAVGHAIRMLAERGNSLIVAGTGAGKTIMLASVIGKFFYGFQAVHKRRPHVLVLVHRTEIHGQNHAKFSGVCPEIATSEITARKKSLRGNIHFGMVQTVIGLLPEFERSGSFFDLIVIDESHHAGADTYEKIINWNRQGRPDAALLGVTATPNRGDKLPLIHLFDNFYQITTRFLIDSHYLVRPEFIDLSPTFAVDGKEEKGHLSKYWDALKSNKMLPSLCDLYLTRKQQGKAVIFAPSHEFCKAIYNELKGRGRKPAYLSLGLPDDQRRDEIERFESGDAEELINVDIATEGYDFPPITNVVDFDTNGTHGQWVQKVGRGLRVSPGKTGCTVIDFGGNIELYPQGVETDVNLEGETVNARGEPLTEADLFREPEEHGEAYVTAQANACYTPYTPPPGFETVSDKEHGIVFVACGAKRDCIIVRDGESFIAFLGDKKRLTRGWPGDFSACVVSGYDWLGDIAAEAEKHADKPVSRIQERMLAPEFPANAMTWYGANCCLCWKAWRLEIKKQLGLPI